MPNIEMIREKELLSKNSKEWLIDALLDERRERYKLIEEIRNIKNNVAIALHEIMTIVED